MQKETFSSGAASTAGRDVPTQDSRSTLAPPKPLIPSSWILLETSDRPQASNIILRTSLCRVFFRNAGIFDCYSTRLMQAPRPALGLARCIAMYCIRPSTRVVQRFTGVGSSRLHWGDRRFYYDVSRPSTPQYRSLRRDAPCSDQL